MEGDTLALGFGGGMAKAVVAHGAEAGRQDVAQVTFYKLLAWDRLDARGVAIGSVGPAEADMGIGNGNDT